MQAWRWPPASKPPLVSRAADPSQHPSHSPKVMYTEYQDNLEVANEQLDGMRNKLLTEEIKKGGGK